MVDWTVLINIRSLIGHPSQQSAAQLPRWRSTRLWKLDEEWHHSPWKFPDLSSKIFPALNFFGIRLFPRAPSQQPRCGVLAFATLLSSSMDSGRYIQDVWVKHVYFWNNRWGCKVTTLIGIDMMVQHDWVLTCSYV
jgi:hypothetical protein